MQPCPCNPSTLYKDCCFLFHSGEKIPKVPLEVMKSRYSAYAVQNAGYIMDTTHPKSPHFEKDKVNWALSIEKFGQETLFLKLEILEDTHYDKTGFVTFNAILEKNGEDASFQERSKFIYENNLWFYFDGKPIMIKKKLK